MDKSRTRKWYFRKNAGKSKNAFRCAWLLLVTNCPVRTAIHPSWTRALKKPKTKKKQTKRQTNKKKQRKPERNENKKCC
jgi:hypothetical protein